MATAGFSLSLSAAHQSVGGGVCGPSDGALSACWCTPPSVSDLTFAFVFSPLLTAACLFYFLPCFS